MGSFTSRHFEEIFDEDDEQVKDAEPQPSPQSQRVLEAFLDPRSPSTDITRTPISVEKTPDAILDPRSPTSGIARTPIYEKSEDPQKVKVTGETPIIGYINRLNIMEDENTSMTSAPDATSPLIEEGEATAAGQPGDAVRQSAPEVVSLNRSLSEPDLSPQDDVLLLGNRDVTARLSFSEPSPAPKKSSARPLFVIHPGSDVVPSTDKPVQHSPRRHLKEGPQRSPLTTRNIDRNTPRAIVQRKQATRLTSLKNADGVSLPMKSMLSPVKKYQALDKENADV